MPVLNTRTKLEKLILEALAFIFINSLIYFYFKAKAQKNIRRSQILETAVALIVGSCVLINFIFQIKDAKVNSYKAQSKLQLYSFILSSESLLWFIVLISVIKSTKNIILYIILSFSGYIALLFSLQHWINGAKAILQSVVVIGLIIYLERRNVESFLENWKLKAAGVLYKSVLNSLPESIMVITEGGKVEYQNEYMKKMFEHDIKNNLEDFYSNFSNLKLRDCIEETKFKLLSSNAWLSDKNITFKSMKKLKLLTVNSESLFKVKAAEVKTLDELVKFFKNNVDLWRVANKYTLIYDTKYIHPLSDRILSIEIKAFALIEDEEAELALIFRDTTDRDRVATLEAENESYKNNIIASFSHELRTPLNSNMGLIEQSLSRNDVSEEVKKTLLEPALISSKLLLCIINDILDYSQILSHKFKLNIRPNPINNTISKCLALFESRVLAKDLQLDLNIDLVIAPFHTDHQRFSQVLVNMLSNALKFTSEGTIQVNFKKESDDCYKISVFDTGIGMDFATQEKLRRNLSGSTMKSKVSSESSGIGFGLLISSVLCQHLSSKDIQGLKFTSEKGSGSEFFFYLKEFGPDQVSQDPKLIDKKELFKTTSLIAEEEDDSHIIGSSTTLYRTKLFRNKLTETNIQMKSTEESKGKNPVLVVDDEVFNIMILESYCKSAGLDTERAFNGQQALERVNEVYNNNLKISMVLMDINMPIMDGYETTLALKEMVSKQKIDDLIVIGVTAYVSQDKIEKCYQCGMTEVVHKPLSQSEFISLMIKYGILAD